MSRRLSDEEITRALRDLPDWRRVDDEIHASYDLASFQHAVDLVVEVGRAAPEHSPLL